MTLFVLQPALMEKKNELGSWGFDMHNMRMLRSSLFGWLTRLSAITVMPLTLIACSSTEPGTGPPAKTLLIPSWTFDGHQFHDDLAVLVSGSAILKVGDADELRPHADAVENLPNSTLLPGFIDLHVHLGAVGDYAQLTSKGVTTARDVGISESVLPIPRAGGLEVLFAGPILTAPGGYPIPIHGKSAAGPVKGERQARAQVAELAELGATVIKIALSDGKPKFDWPTLSPGELRAIVEEAHANNLQVTGHLFDKEDVGKALDAGVDEWAHMPCSRIPSSLIDRAIEADVAAVGTLHIHERCSALLSNTRRFLAAGGTVLYGSDMGNSGIPFGIDIRELELMIRAGMTLEEALTAATAAAGEHLGLAPLGALIEGAPADLVVVSGDLRESLDGLERPSAVVVDGKLLEP